MRSLKKKKMKTKLSKKKALLPLKKIKKSNTLQNGKALSEVKAALKIQTKKSKHSLKQNVTHTPSEVVVVPQKSTSQNLSTTVSRKEADDFFIRSWVLEKAIHSRRAYLRISSEYREFILPKRLKQTALSDLQNFLEIKTHYSKSTQAQRRAVLKSLYSFGLRTGYLKANLGAFLKSIRLESKLTERYLEEDEVKLLLTHAQNKRDEMILKLLYYTGLRVSECAALTWKDIKDKQSKGKATGAVIRVMGKGEKERVVFITLKLYEELKAFRDSQTTLKGSKALFFTSYAGGTVLSVRQIVNIIKSTALRAGLTKIISPHWLRHAHASHALDRGAPIHLVQATLGHASIATTGKYLHARPNESSGNYLEEST